MCCSEKLEKIKWEFLLQKLRQKNPIFQINDSSVQFHRWRAIEQKCPCKNRILRDMGHIYFSGTNSNSIPAFQDVFWNWVYICNYIFSTFKNHIWLLSDLTINNFFPNISKHNFFFCIKKTEFFVFTNNSALYCRRGKHARRSVFHVGIKYKVHPAVKKIPQLRIHFAP